MKLDEKSPPRAFTVGLADQITIKDCGTLHLEPDEQVTLVTASGAEYDVARKDWGFYATPSTNGRLAEQRLRAALVKNRVGRFYVMLVERGHEASFERYLREEDNHVIAWLDDSDDLRAIEQAVASR